MRLCRQSNHCRSILVPLSLTLAALSGWVFFLRAEDTLLLYTITLLVVGVVILDYLSTDSGADS
jgi:multidrug transporter EmrE-like cation transporter